MKRSHETAAEDGGRVACQPEGPLQGSGCELEQRPACLQPPSAEQVQAGTRQELALCQGRRTRAEGPAGPRQQLPGGLGKPSCYLRRMLGRVAGSAGRGPPEKKRAG